MMMTSLRVLLVIVARALLNSNAGKGGLYDEMHRKGWFCQYVEEHSYHACREAKHKQVSPTPLLVWLSGPEIPADMIEWNAKYLPAGTQFCFVDDAEEINKMVFETSELLHAKSNIKGVYDAFMDLIPKSYKSDLWRAMMMWRFGGLYMDNKMYLATHLSEWIDISSDAIPLPFDDMAHPDDKSIWPGILFSPIRELDVWEHVLRYQIKQIDARYCGNGPHSEGGDAPCCLNTTGPLAYYNALESMMKANAFPYYRNVRWHGLSDSSKCPGFADGTYNYAILRESDGSCVSVANRKIHTQKKGQHWTELCNAATVYVEPSQRIINYCLMWMHWNGLLTSLLILTMFVKKTNKNVKKVMKLCLSCSEKHRSWKWRSSFLELVNRSIPAVSKCIRPISR